MNPSRLTRPIFFANLLYLISMLLILTVGSEMQNLNLSWGLIATEVLLILLSAVAFLRLYLIPLKEGLRIRPIRPLIGILCVLLGFATFLFSIIIDAIMAQLTRMPSVALPAESMPKGVLGTIVFFLGIAFFAPLCEEALFRGVIQGVYEQQRPARSAITITALMFAFWHLRLSGLPGLLPAAFILGFVAWSTRSIYASILVHFGLNAPSAIHTLLALNNGQGLPFLGLPAAAVGLIVTVILIYAIWRLSSGVTHPAEQEPVKYSSWKWDYLPLIGVGLIYLGVSGWTAIASLFTGQITLAQAGYDKVQISQTIENRFRIADQGGNDVGQMVCTITPVDSKIRLDCTSQVRAYEVNTSFGFFKDGDHHAAWSVTWDSNTMNLLDFSYERAYADAAANVRAIVKDGRLVVETAAAIQELAVSPDTLMEYEWAWRVNALRPQVFTSIQSSFCYLLQWNEQAGKSSPMLKTKILRLTASDWIDLPAARVKASKASLGSQVAWYAKDYTGPARFEDGMLIYEQVK